MTSLVALLAKFGGGIPAGRLLANGSADNTFGGPHHQVWWGDPCGDAAGQRWRKQHLWHPRSPSLGASSLRGCCWSMAAHTTPLAVLAINFGGEILAGMLLTDADGGADNAFDGPGHQVWRGAP